MNPNCSRFCRLNEILAVYRFVCILCRFSKKETFLIQINVFLLIYKIFLRQEFTVDKTVHDFIFTGDRRRVAPIRIVALRIISWKTVKT